MKTILYQPLFINPQAYFVFPQLYHIEKGDSYIEPANITGQLIINDLTKVLTSTPTLNVVQDTNQVDFGLFKGKHIRISQYTNIGAVVLGEWYIPGTPEPEQPDWFKESIVAWYSPYCKQGMTNFDVIESYAEDFTRLYYYEHRGTIDRTPNKIVITESKTGILNIIENINTSTNDIVIKVTGVSEELKLFVQDINSVRQYISKDGVYKFTNNVYQFFGFGINKVISGINVVIEQLPTSILKDFSGNKHDAYLYGFKGKLNSGVGIYAVDFTSYSKTSVVADVSHNTVKVVPAANNYLFIRYATTEMPAYTVNVQNLGNNVLTYQYATENGRREITLTEGINELPESIKTEEDYQVGFRVNAGTGEITITQIPDYPDQLCYSGKEYCISYNQPILTDYTVIADRTWFDNNGNRVFITKGNIWPNCAFTFEKINVALHGETFSYSQSTNIDDLIGKSGITYQTKQSYNGKVIGVGTSSDGDILLIGGQLKGEYIGCHSDFLLFNRTLNEDEINWLKENIYNIEI